MNFIIILICFMICTSECHRTRLGLKSWKVMRWMWARKMRNIALYDLHLLKVKSCTKGCMKNLTIQIIVGNKLPYVQIVNETKTTAMLDGYIGKLWNTLSIYLEFDTMISIIKVDDERGALKEYSDRDLILNPVVIQASDLSEFDHTMPLAFTWYQLFSKVDMDNGSSEFYISIWGAYLWLAFFMTICLLSILLWFINSVSEHFSPSFHPGMRKPMSFTGKLQDSSVVSCLISILGSITNQGVQVRPNCASMRIITLVSIVFGLVMSTAYSGLLISKLATIATTETGVTSLDSVADQSTHSLCVSPTSIAYDYFKEDNNPYKIKKQWATVLNRPPCSVGADDLIPCEDYCAPHTIVMESLHSSNYILNNCQQKCQVTKHPQKYFISYVSVLVRKGFPYTKLLSKYLLKFHSAGIISRLQQQWLPSRFEKSYLGLEYEYIINFRHIKDILIIYLFAVLVSVMVFIVEYLFFMRFPNHDFHYSAKNFRESMHSHID